MVGSQEALVSNRKRADSRAEGTLTGGRKDWWRTRKETMMIDRATAQAIAGGSIGWAKFLVWLNYVLFILLILSALGAFSKYTSGWK